MYSTICRVATVLQSRYTAPGFWIIGLRLFEEVENLVTESSEKERMRNCIAGERHHLNEMQTEVPLSDTRPAATISTSKNIYFLLSELHPQNLLTRLAVAQDLASASGSSRGQEEHSNAGGVEIDESVRESIDNMQEIGGSMDLDSAIEASLQVCFALISSSYHMACKFIGDRPPPASKEEIIARLGSETECAVCWENLAVDDKMQELPCKHLFHPPCLKPWLDEHNSCPRHELRTDDHAYESWKERE
ncbi:unnamed protein product, partial [Musa banksii]